MSASDSGLNCLFTSAPVWIFAIGVTSVPSLCYPLNVRVRSSVVYPGRSLLSFACHAFSRLCEGVDQVIHQDTMIKQWLYRSEEIISSGRLATGFFGEVNLSFSASNNLD